MSRGFVAVCALLALLLLLSGGNQVLFLQLHHAGAVLPAVFWRLLSMLGEWSLVIAALLLLAALTPDTLRASPDWLTVSRGLKALLGHEQTLWGLGAAVLSVSVLGITLSEWSRRAWRRQLGRQRRTQRGMA